MRVINSSTLSSNGSDRYAFISIAACLLAPMSMGIGLGFTGPTIDTMRNTVKDIEGGDDGDGSIIDIGVNSNLFVLSSTTISTLFSGALVLGALIGSLIGGPLGEFTGRRIALLIAAPISAIAYLTIALSSSPALLISSRLVAGLALGLSSFIAPVYVGEISPTRYRGMLGAGVQLLLAGGMVYIYAMGLAFRTDGSSVDHRVTSDTFSDWRMVSYMCMIPCILLFIGMYFASPSPRWLATKGRLEEAKVVLSRLRGLPPSMISDEIAAIECIAVRQTVESFTIGDALKVMMECKKQSFIAIMVHFLTQLSGLNALAFYLTPIFMEAGLTNADLMSLTVQLATMFATIPASYLIEYLGRRVLLFTGCIVMGISQFLSALYFYLDRNNEGTSSSSLSWLVLLGVYGYQISFAWGVGPIRWILAAELFPCRSRGVAASLAVTANWLSAFAFILVLDPLVEATSLYATFWSFAAASWILATFIWFMVPETKGKTFEEIQLHFKRSSSISVPR